MNGNEIHGDIKNLIQIGNFPGGTIEVRSTDGEMLRGPFLAPPRLPHKLIGRDELLHELKEQMLSGGDSLSLLLKGMPGVGKTALAVTLANDADVLKHFEGILWAGLGPEANPLSVLVWWAKRLGIGSDEIDSLADIDKSMQAVRDKIIQRRMLIVLDDAWDQTTTRQLRLGGPYCVHLVTTRSGEVAQDFAGPQIKEVKELSEADGLKLLAEFAPTVAKENPGEAKDLVQLVGCLPLALVLIGKNLQQGRDTRSRILRRLKEQLKHRLKLEMRQYPSGHPGLPPDVPLSLPAVIGTSDQALDNTTRRKLRLLTVLPPKPNTFSESAALIVSRAREDTLYKLVNYGLLERCGEERCGEERYTLHQIIADYAKSKKRYEKFLELFLRRERSASRRMAAFFVKYVQDHRTNYSVLVLETGNVRAALEAAFNQKMYETYVQGASAFGDFLHTKGWYEQAAKQLKQAAQVANFIGDFLGLGKICLRLGQIEESCGNYLSAEQYLQRGLQICHYLEEREKINARVQMVSKVLHSPTWNSAVALLTCDLFMAFGVLERNQTNYARAEGYLRHALDIAEWNKDAIRMGLSLHLLASVERNRGEFEKAEELLMEAQAISHRVKDARLNCRILMGLGMLESCRENHGRAEKYLEDILKMPRPLDDPEIECFRLYIQGTIAYARKDYAKAQESFRGGFDLSEKIGHRWYEIAFLIKDAELDLEEQRVSLAPGYFSSALDRAQELGSTDLTALALYGLARVEAARENIPEARQYGQRSLKALQEISHYKAPEIAQWLSKLPE